MPCAIQLHPRGFAPGSTVTRYATLTPASYSAARRTVEAVLSTGAQVRRWGVIEELAIEPEAIDLNRVALGQVRLLDHHNAYARDAVLGVLVDARFENGSLVGTLRFGDTDEARSAEGMVQRGELTGISIGYQVRTWTLRTVEDNTEIWRADRWELLEVSLVSVPADPHAAVRSTDENRLHHRANAHTQEVDMRHSVSAAVDSEPIGSDSQASAMDNSERRRIATIRDIGERARLGPEVIDRAIKDGTTVEAMRERAFEVMTSVAARTATSNVHDTGHHATFANPEFRQRAMSAAIHARTNRSVEIDGPAQEFADTSLVNIARHCLEHAGERGAWRRSDTWVVTRALTTSDFPVVLGAANRLAIMAIYQLSESPLKRIGRKVGVRDSRKYLRPRAGEFPALEKVTEDGEIKSGFFDEGGEPIKIDTYAKLLPITRQVIVNDDIGMLDTVARTHGQAAAALEARILVALLNANAGAGVTMSDGHPVFYAGHKNIAAAGGAPAIETMGSCQLALRNQTNMSGELINASGRFIVVPAPLEVAALQTVGAITATKATDANPFAGKLDVAVESRLDDAAAWYVFVDPAALPVIEYAYLDGSPEGPEVFVEEGFDVEGIRTKVRLDFGATVSDWRGAVRNAGS